MKKRGLVTLAVALLFFVSCAGTSFNIKVKDEPITLLQKSAISSIGYLIAKNNPEDIPAMVEWYDKYRKLDALVDINVEFQKGVDSLAKMVTDDPFLYMQLSNCMDMLEISYVGPQLPEEIEKYGYVVDYFMLGVRSYSE